jgi:hypothetical protein
MDLRGGDPESTRSACVKLRDLAVAAEGPGAPFTATRRGQQLLRLIHIVVQNVGLEDKVGALTALRLLKADDTLLQKLLKEGILPPLLAIIARDAEDADGDWLDADGENVSGVSADGKILRAETAAAAARAVEAFSSSGDSLTTLLRGGAVEVLSDRLCRAKGELADAPLNAESAILRSARAATAAACAVALSRISGSNLASAQDFDPFGNPLDFHLDEDAMDGDGKTADATETHNMRVPNERAAAAMSTARSLLCLLESDAVVAHRAAAAGLAKLAASGRAGRIATARCGAVLPLMTAALAGNAAQRAAALAALDAVTRGERDGSATRDANRHRAGADADVAMSDCPNDEEDDFSLPAGDLEMDDNGGVVSAAAASRAAREAEAASVEAVNQKTNEKLSRHETRSAIPLGTAAKVGETFFGHLIEVLAGLTTLRGVLTRAAADASLALWALAWQPSNRRRMSGRGVIDPLVALYKEGAPAAADDAGAVLGVLARVCDVSRENIQKSDPVHGRRLLRHLLDPHPGGSNPDSPGGSAGGAGAENYFKSRAFFKTEKADEEDGEKSSPGTGDVPGTSPNVSTSPNIRRTISGQHMAAAIARASPNKR